jgi:diguanylate cyclase (GGDEF)-like protein
VKLSFLKTRYILYAIFFTILGSFLFNFLLAQQSEIMYKYFIEKPTAYNLEKAQRLSDSIYQSFRTEVTTGDIEEVTRFVNKYNDIPFLNVDVVYIDPSGNMRSVLHNIRDVDVLSAEYVFPVKAGAFEGNLLVYNINKEYKKGIEEYSSMLIMTRVVFSILIFLLIFIILYREYSAKIEEEKILAEYQAIHDGLTGLYTHKHFKEKLEKEMNRAQRHGSELSFLMCDIDHFKRINDTYGHPVGDEVIKAVVRTINENTRSYDIVARYGGEEFAILLPESGKKTPGRTLAAESLEVAKRIKAAIAKTQVPLATGEIVKITISMGLAHLGSREKLTGAELLKEGDTALYESKNSGRDMITVFDHVSGKLEKYK